MKKTTIALTLLSALMLTSNPLLAQNEPDREILLSGRDWQFREGPVPVGNAIPAELAGGEWMPAEVPGNVQADLDDLEKLGAWTYGATDPRVYQPEKQNWWYQKSFAVPKALQDRRLSLVFDGVDHQCDVWLNGKFLGSHAGMFRRFSFEVAGKIRFDAPNELLVFIHRIPESITDRGPWISKVWTELKDLKSLTSNAWDWTPNALWSLGIWKNVRLEATGPTRIDWVQVTTKLTKEYRQANITTRLELDCQTGGPAVAEFHLTGHGADVRARVPAVLQTGSNVVSGELVLKNPELWWPNGQGGQPLYELESVIKDAAGTILDRRVTRIGIRELKWEQCEGAAADFRNPYRLLVNGRPVQMFGPNITPSDMFYGRAHQPGNRQLQRLVELAREAGMNALRVWGGGVIFSDEFYAAADRYGILLSLEFPLSAYVPPAEPAFLKNLDATVRQTVRLLRNHPSIVEWTGGNEVPFASVNYNHPTLDIMRRAVAELDDRIFRDSDPIDGGEHSPYTYRPDDRIPLPEFYYRWRQHYAHYNDLKSRFGAPVMRYGEFGAQTSANLEVWQRELPPASSFPATNFDDPALKIHRALHAFEDKNIWFSRPVITYLFGEPRTLEEMVKGGQFIGAEGLRYAYDELRRKGAKLGGMFSWHYTEPWPNVAGNYMVDFDGRPLMNYDLLRSAFAPITIGIRQDAILYDPTKPVEVSLRVQNDSGSEQKDLRWSWVARDRRGNVFAQNKGTVAAAHQVSAVAEEIKLTPPRETALGPIFLELALADATGKTLTERIHVLSSNWTEAPLRGLLDGTLGDPDDLAAFENPPEKENPNTPENLALSSRGNIHITATSILAGYEPVAQTSGAVGLMPGEGSPVIKLHHGPTNLIDGLYGNDSAWIPNENTASFLLDLGADQTFGRFRLGRDRLGTFADRSLGALTIEVSPDATTWQKVYDTPSAAALPGYRPTATMEVQVQPVKARFVRVTVSSAVPGLTPAIDEFEVLPARVGKDAPSVLPAVAFGPFTNKQPARSVKRTTLDAEVLGSKIEGEDEILTLRLKNTGAMTALFSSVHPLLDYRNDFYLSDNHLSIPPGETRDVTLRASNNPKGGLTLGQTGWRIGTWNAPDVVIEPTADVLLAIGRKDRMTREFAGGAGGAPAINSAKVRLAGRLPAASSLPLLMKAGRLVEFAFPISDAPRATVLRIHTADQSPAGASLRATLNGRAFTAEIPAGLGLQKADPHHLAKAKSVEITLPADALRQGENTLTLELANDGWFTWDSIDLR